MTDINLKTIASGYNLSKINDNFEKVEAVINDEIVHATGGNNTMSQELDMNGNRILNLPTPVGGTEPLRKGDITSDATGATIQYVDDSTINALSQAYTFKTVALMQASLIVLPLGKKVFWQGYHAESDGGSNWGIVTSGVHTDDGGSTFTLSDGKYVAANIKGSRISIQKFGAEESQADNSTYIQSLLDYISTGDAIYVPPGNFLSDNLVLPNIEFSLLGDGRNVSILRAKAGLTNTGYFIAPAQYVNDSTTGSAPITMNGIEVRGDGNALYPFVWYGFFADYELCHFRDPSSGGSAFLLTSDGIGGAASASTLVENRFDKCKFDGNNVGKPFLVLSAGQKLTDVFFTDNLIYDGDCVFTSMGGWNVSGNHFYSGTTFFNRLSFGTRINNNWFEELVELNDFIDETVSFDNNTLVDDVTVKFGGVGRVIVMNGNNFQGAGAQVVHDFFAANKHIVINGGSFSNVIPVVWPNPSSTGRVTMNDVFVYDAAFDSIGAGYMLRGSKDAGTGRFYRSFYANAAPTTLAWSRGDTVINGIPSAGGNYGFVCVTDGTPGTWKAYGTIAV